MSELQKTDGQFRNCSFFILPLRVNDRKKLDAFVSSGLCWLKVDRPFDTQYLLRYAADMNGNGDNRLTSYVYDSAEKLPLYMFDGEIAEKMKESSLSWSEISPALENIRLYVFGSGVAFLEFEIGYGDMSADEIVEFVYYFRSLRFNEKRAGSDYPEGKLSLESAVDKVLPCDRSGTELCFSNPSEIKKQALIFSAVNIKEEKAGRERINRLCYYLSNGYNSSFTVDSVDFSDTGDISGKYEMRFYAGRLCWAGTQDGLACVTDRPLNYQFRRIYTDYHFLYLMLLNQRFSSLSYIEELTYPGIDLDGTKEIRKKVVDLKTRYSFRVISDDRNFQTLYGNMYEVLEIDNLLADLEDSNDRLDEILKGEQQKRGKSFELLLFALSFLALFSALVDLADYLEKFRLLPAESGKWISLGVNAVIIAVALCIILIHKKQKKIK